MISRDSNHRLIRDEQLGATHESASDRNALSLPAQEDVRGEWARCAMPSAFEGGHDLGRHPAVPTGGEAKQADRTTSIALADRATERRMRWGT